MISTALTQFNDNGFDEFIATRNEPGWLIDQRRGAWKKFQDLAWPTQRDEEWMRTDIRMFNLEKFAIPAGGDAELSIPEGQLARGVDIGGQSIALNGISRESNLDEDLKSRGVIFGSLSDLSSEHSAIIQKFLFRKALSDDLDRFAALHAACLLYTSPSPRDVEESRMPSSA